jgi:hypothetical protein
MEDPSCSGELRLPPPRVITGKEILEKGEVVVFATPTEPGVSESEKVQEGPILPIRSDKDRTEVLADRDAPDRPAGSTEGSDGGTWMIRPSAPVLSDPEKDLWHYSDASGFIGVVTTHSLWATSLGALNDSAEYKHGRELLDQILAAVMDSKFVHPLQKDYLKGIVDISDTTATRPGLFVLCASMAAHSLAQWRAYGGSHGHAITLDPKGKLAILSPETKENTVDTIPHGWKQVLYDTQEQAELILEALAFVAYSAPFDGRKASRTNESDRAHALVINEALAHCKEPSFAEEQEVRILIQAPSSAAIRFRHGATGVTPYLVLTGTTDEAARPTTKAHPLPIRGAVIGPFTDREASAEGTVALLEAAGYDAATVAVSSSTLR